MTPVELVESSREAAAPVTPPAPSPGAQLAAAREAQRLSVAEVANRLKLSVQQVEALEQDACDRLPGPVFVRGFARNYARLLRLDADAVVLAFDAHLPRPPAPQATREANIPMPARSGGRWPWLAGVAAAVFLGAALIDALWEEGATGVAPVPAPVAAVPVDPTPVLPALDAPARPATTEVPTSVAAAPPVPVTAPATPTLTPTPPPPAAVPAAPASPVPAREVTAGGRALNLTFDQACWVQVKDAKGNVVLEGLFPAGSSRQIVAAAPLSVVLGNAPGVRLSYGDKVIDVAAQTRDAVARVTVE